MSTAVHKVEFQQLVREIDDVFILRDFVGKARKQGKEVEVQLDNSIPMPIKSLEDLNKFYHKTFFTLKYRISNSPLLMTIYFVE